MSLCLKELCHSVEKTSIIHLEEGVFGHDHDGLLLVFLQELRRHILVKDHEAEHVFVEPPVGHHDVAFLPAVGPP